MEGLKTTYVYSFCKVAYAWLGQRVVLAAKNSVPRVRVRINWQNFIAHALWYVKCEWGVTIIFTFKCSVCYYSNLLTIVSIVNVYSTNHRSDDDQLQFCAERRQRCCLWYDWMLLIEYALSWLYKSWTKLYDNSVSMFKVKLRKL